MDVDLNYTYDYKNGVRCWSYRGCYHRIGAPAVIHDTGVESWWYYGVRHRIDGPARIYNDGTHDWYLDGQLFIFEDYCEQLIYRGYANDEDTVILKLKYGR